ncbi:F-box protein SKIP2-like [Polistes fuscatus]|uniref:F-box protein SKIP2-like n=1 Tax=Polistes fuscatus TaxID=30207 RepID=UPI001CA8A3F0|nr:F-box protein SKIP2-like [Polistes fuscatus]
MNKFFCEALKRIRAETENGADRITEEGVLPTTINGTPIRKLFVCNVAQRTTFKDLNTLFSEYGKVESVYLNTTNSRSNYAFVTFSTVMGAIRAREAGSNKCIHLHSRDLKVMPADPWHQPDRIQFKSNNSTKDSNKSREMSLIEETDTITLIDVLNDDCLMHVFLYLPIMDRIAIERVCKRWKDVSKKSWYNVKKLDLSNHRWGILSHNKRINTSDLRQVLLRCGRFLTQIDFPYEYRTLTRSTLLIIAKLCPNLEIVDFSGIELSSSGLELFSDNCTNIKKLSLAFYTSSSSNTIDRDLTILFHMSKRLTYVSLREISILGKCLEYLSSDTLEELVLISCNNITGRYFINALENLKNLKRLVINKGSFFASVLLEEMAKYCTNLQHFELTNVDFSAFYYRDSNILPLTKFVNLETLKLSTNSFVDNFLLIALASTCTKLTYLDIENCNKVTDTGLQAVATLPKLETLIINNLTQITAVGLDNMCSIRRLECKYCVSIRDTGLVILLHASPNLELLDLTGCNGITNNTINVAEYVTSRRSNNIVLKMYIGETSVTRHIHTSPNLMLLRIRTTDC